MIGRRFIRPRKNNPTLIVGACGMTAASFCLLDYLAGCHRLHEQEET
jgi:hypothetical protein